MSWRIGLVWGLVMLAGVTPAAAQRPNGFATVQAVATAQPEALRASCGNWEFMDRVVDALRAQSPRWGYNAKRGNMGDPSHDAIAYFWGEGGGEGSTQVYIFDIIGGHCGDRPAPAWIDQTEATAAGNTVGKLIACRPGRANCGAYATGGGQPGGGGSTPPPPPPDLAGKLNELITHVAALTATVEQLRATVAGQRDLLIALDTRLSESWAARLWSFTDTPPPACVVEPWALEGRVFGARVTLRPVQ